MKLSLVFLSFLLICLCLLAFSAEARDVDSDGLDDAIDPDDDNDGILDIEDPDDDNDGILDIGETFKSTYKLTFLLKMMMTGLAMMKYRKNVKEIIVIDD